MLENGFLMECLLAYHSDFSNCECYLTPADLGGFAITPQRELVRCSSKIFHFV